MYFRSLSLWYMICFWLSCFTHMVMSGTLGACRSDDVCGPGYCCAFRVSYNTGFCMPTKSLGDICSISYMKGRSFTCGCKKGLTCAIVDKDRITGQPKTRCVEIPYEAAELSENVPSNTTNIILKLLTARELQHLLDIMSENSKSRKK